MAGAVVVETGGMDVTRMEETEREDGKAARVDKSGHGVARRRRKREGKVAETGHFGQQNGGDEEGRMDRRMDGETEEDGRRRG